MRRDELERAIKHFVEALCPEDLLDDEDGEEHEAKADKEQGDNDVDENADEDEDEDDELEDDRERVYARFHYARCDFSFSRRGSK